MGLFGAVHRKVGGAKRLPFPKICHTYPTMMKLDAQLYMNHVTQPVSFADINFFLREIRKLPLYQEMQI